MTNRENWPVQLPRPVEHHTPLDFEYRLLRAGKCHFDREFATEGVMDSVLRKGHLSVMQVVS